MTAPTLTRSPESRIFLAAFDIIQNDQLLASTFSPILLVETQDREALASWADGTLICQPLPVGKDMPSERQKINPVMLVSLYLKTDETNENSPLLASDYHGHLRKLFWGISLTETVSNVTTEISNPNTFIVPLTPLIPREGTRILSYRLTFDSDVDPTKNDFTS